MSPSSKRLVKQLLAMLVVLGGIAVYLGYREAEIRRTAAELAGRLEIEKHRDEVAEARELGVLRAERPALAKFTVRYGQTTYAVASRDAAAVAFVREKSKAVSGSVRVFFGDGDAFPFAAVYSRAADYAFASAETVARALPRLTLAQRQATAVVGRASAASGASAAGGAEVLVIGRTL